MNDKLRQAFELAEQRSEAEQELLAQVLFEEMRAEDKWDALFADPRSEALLEKLVAEAQAEDDAGETEEITGDTLLV